MSERSERLRQRRQQRGETDEPAEQSDTSEPSKPSEPAEQSEPDETGESSESVKDEQIGTYMYLPEGQHDALKNTYNLLKAKYEAEFDEEFEKNRHFFPLVVEYGLDSLDGADAGDVRELLEEMASS